MENDMLNPISAQIFGSYDEVRHTTNRWYDLSKLTLIREIQHAKIPILIFSDGDGNLVVGYRINKPIVTDEWNWTVLDGMEFLSDNLSDRDLAITVGNILDTMRATALVTRTITELEVKEAFVEGRLKKRKVKNQDIYRVWVTKTRNPNAPTVQK